MDHEIWKDIKGYEGYYQVSNLGRIKSLDRYVETTHPISKSKYFKKVKGLMLKQCYVKGYLSVNLSKNGRSTMFRVNRLVALNFIENPNKFPHVGHNDDNKENNKVNNLYWTTAKENNTHNNKHMRVGQKVSKPIIGINDNEMILFNSSIDAGKNGFNSSAIRNCLTGRSKTHKGYVWSYANAN